MSHQIGQKVRIRSRRASVEQYNGAIGEIVEIPTPGLVRICLGRLTIAFTENEVEEIYE